MGHDADHHTALLVRCGQTVLGRLGRFDSPGVLSPLGVVNTEIDRVTALKSSGSTSTQQNRTRALPNPRDADEVRGRSVNIFTWRAVFLFIAFH